jgi:hypothetical protein
MGKTKGFIKTKSLGWMGKTKGFIKTKSLGRCVGGWVGLRNGFKGGV